jgi:BolA protein
MPIAISGGVGQGGPLQQLLAEKIAAALAPAHLEVRNESGMHNVPPGAESHFKVVVVSAAFAGQPPVVRHRLVNTAVRDELRDRVHALSISAFTPEEWRERGGSVRESPECRGGSKA